VTAHYRAKDGQGSEASAESLCHIAKRTTQADALRPLMENSRRLRELTTELATLALQ
jgi:hypothetical protein